MAQCGGPLLWFAAVVLSTAPLPAAAQQIDTIKEIVERLRSCWVPPPHSPTGAIDITVIVSFNREGAILGRPKVTFETEGASDSDRLAYRVAAMEALQRCTPLPFTGGLGGAVAGRPFAVRFWTRKTPPKPAERRAWLTLKIP